MELPDYDSLELTGTVTDRSAAAEPPTGIFSFPKGAKPGTFCHDLFENLDFTISDNSVITELVSKKLKAYGYSHDWKDTITHMATNVLNTSISIGNSAFSFSRVTNENRLNELEFYFPLNTVTPESLKNVFDKYVNSGVADTFPEAIERLNFSPVKGFMKGYIDLVFKYQDRYYIVDWKSNHLGNSHRDYNRENLEAVMTTNYYTLQYYIYTVAIHKYLSTRLKSYSYNRDFGGVLYVFLRGVDPKYGDNYGIFADKPDVNLVDELTDFLISGNTK
jgi:exodeoxyribonuclease V beta subunit